MVRLFVLYVCQKQIYQPEMWRATCPDMVLQRIFRFLKILKILDFKKAAQKIQFFILGSKNSFWGKSETAILKALVCYVFGCFYLLFASNLHFRDFSNIYQFPTKNCMTLGHLIGINKKNRKKIVKILHKDVKLM